MGAKDCLPPGVKIIRVSGQIATLTFDRWSNAKFEQSLFRWLNRESFQRLPTFHSASVKIRRQAKTTEGKINYRPCSTRNFEATGAAGENLRPFSFCGSDRLLRESTRPWLVYIEGANRFLKNLQEWPLNVNLALSRSNASVPVMGLSPCTYLC